MIDEIIKLLDKYIATDDDGCQWLTIEFNELKELIRDLEDNPKKWYQKLVDYIKKYKIF